MVTAILDLRRVVETGTGKEITAAIEKFGNQTEGRLDPAELSSEVAKAESAVMGLSYAELLQRGEPLRVVATMSDEGLCYYRKQDVRLERSRGDDDQGQLDMSDKGIFFDAYERLTLPWTKILTLSLSGQLLIVHRNSGGEPYSFDLRNPPEARLAHLIALTIWKQQATSKQKKKSRKSSPRTEPAKESSTEPPFSSPAGVTIELPNNGGAYLIQVVGESYCQPALKALGGERRLRGEFVYGRART
jgi:hypothetical protein